MHKRRLRPLSVLFVFASILFLLSPTFILTPSMAVAASTPATSDIQLPPHAVWQPWGSDWECKRGYRREGERCVEVDVPPHAFLDYFGHDWECQRGYRQEGEGCVPVQVPKHAHLDITGHGWECDRGYRREGERCVEVNVPPHAFLNYFGHDWECERGYRQEGEGCVPVQVPKHAHLAYSGHDWSCNAGYERVDNICERLLHETLNRAAPHENELAQLATQVYTNRETSHDRQTIEHLQRQLQQAGYDPGLSDGILGPRTLAALQQFLADRGLTAGNVPQTPPHAPDS